MYTVAICDDEAICVAEHSQMAASILTELGVEHRLECFSAAEHLHAVLMAAPERYHLLLLDVAFARQSGMELAHLLRQAQMKTAIIFISGYDAYSLEGYEVQAVQYLLKPVERDKLKAAIS